MSPISIIPLFPSQMSSYQTHASLHLFSRLERNKVGQCLHVIQMSSLLSHLVLPILLPNLSYHGQQQVRDADCCNKETCTHHYMQCSPHGKQVSVVQEHIALCGLVYMITVKFYIGPYFISILCIL